MKICAIDSSGLVASAAILNNDICEAEYSLQHKVTHSQTLLPMLNEITDRLGMDPGEIDAYALAAGPGSFTGLRIGAATVKGLGIAVDRPVVSVPTLEALAYNMYGCGSLVCPIMDARRHQVYTGIYRFVYDADRKTYDMKSEMGQSALSFDELCVRLNELGESVAFIGDGIPVFEKEMPDKLTVPYSIAPVHMNRQRAAAVGALAFRILGKDGYELEGCVTSADEQVPVYLRLSQAEREKKERQSEN